MTSYITRPIPAVLSDPENIGIAVAISLLSCVQTSSSSEAVIWIFHFRIHALEKECHENKLRDEAVCLRCNVRL